MSSRGRKKIPDKIKEQRGTLQPCRSNTDIPVQLPISKMPITPSYFNKDAKRCWRKLGALLLDQGLITSTNIISFEILCSEYGIYREAQNNMKSVVDMIHKGIDSNSNTITRVNALRRISQQAFDNFRKMATEFGLTPSTVSKVTATNDEKKNDPMSDYL